jgi:hypothetical protein
MPIDFPSSPAANQQYTYAGITYTYNGTIWTAVGNNIGKQTIWIPASAMIPWTGTAPSVGTLTQAAAVARTLDFDPSVVEFAQSDIRMPKSWDLNAVLFTPVWSHPATTTNFGVVWTMDAAAVTNAEVYNPAFGGAINVITTGGVTNAIYIGAESTGVGIGSSPAIGDLILFRVYRNATHASDNLAVDARLHGVSICYFTNAMNDA